MSFGYSVIVSGDFETVIQRTKDALTEQGFGVVSEIPVTTIVKTKLDRDFRPFIILGACRPTLAIQALEAEPDAGLFLPCNITIEQADNGIRVCAVDPNVAMQPILGNPIVKAVADDAGPRLKSALDSL